LDALGAIEGGAAAGYGLVVSGFEAEFNFFASAGQKVAGKAPAPKGYEYEVMGVGQSQASQIVGGTAAYLFPGAAALKGIGSTNAPVAERGFDIAVGVSPFVPFGELGAVGKAVVSLPGRVALGAGLGATGTVTRGDYSVTDIGISAGSGAFLSAAVPSVFGRILGGGEEPVEYAPAKPGGEPVPLARGSPPPVGGGGLEKAMEIGPKGEPLGTSPGSKMAGQGMATTTPEETQPPRDLSMLLQEMEGPKPQDLYSTGASRLESEPKAPGIPESKGAPPDLENPNERYLPTPQRPMSGLSSGEPERGPFYRAGSVGAGNSLTEGGGGGGRYGLVLPQGEDLSYARYPPGSAFSETMRFRAAFEPIEEPAPTTEGSVLPPILANIGGRESLAPMSGISSKPDASQGPDIGQGSLMVPGQRPRTGFAPWQIPTPVQTPSGGQTPAQGVKEAVVSEAVMAPPESLLAEPQRRPFAASFSQSYGEKKSKRRTEDVFGFRQLTHGIPSLLDLQIGGAKKRRRGKRS
jgi:hypothetical protein